MERILRLKTEDCLRNLIYFKNLSCYLLTSVLILLIINTTCAQMPPGNYSSSWLGNTFGGKTTDPGGWPNKDDANDKWVQGYISCMYTDADGTCYTNSGWDEAGRTQGVYKNGDVLGNDTRSISCTSAGGYSISGNQITGNGKTISDAGNPTAIAMGRGAYSGKLLVADNGSRKQILVYDVSGSPTIIETIGASGGIASGFNITYDLPSAINAPAYPAGTYGAGIYHPLKFWGLTGVGCDDSGRIFISYSESACGIRCFKKSMVIGFLIGELKIISLLTMCFMMKTKMQWKYMASRNILSLTIHKQIPEKNGQFKVILSILIIIHRIQGVLMI